jgi:predicted SAM-dependent methyltransferase
MRENSSFLMNAAFKSNLKLFVYLGAGSDRIPGFTHMDHSVSKAYKSEYKVQQPEILADLRDGIPIDDCSVDLFYSIHTFEHLSFSELSNCLKECRLKLKIGGGIRIVVPCFDSMIKDYQNQAPVNPEIWEIDPNFPIDTPTKLFIARILYHDHKYLLNFEILHDLLIDSGFSNVNKCYAGETRFDMLKSIFLNKEQTRIGGDLIVEAVNLKPDYYSTRMKRSVISSITTFFNIRACRVRSQLPRFPEKLWFEEKYFKFKPINLKYFDGTRDYK